MRRREFITLLGGVAVAWPLALARAQQTAMPVIGFLSSRTPHESAHLVAAFHRGLAENGYVEGQNVAVEYRWALGQYDRLPALATDLVSRPVAVVASVGGDPAAQAAKAATATIPIVFEMGDPITLGLVTSYNRPGGNATGINILTSALEAKRLGLLRELVPQAEAVGVLLNPNWPAATGQLSDIEDAARAIGVQTHVLRASTDGEIDTAFASLAQHRIPALAVASDPFFTSRRDKLAALAARHAVPAMYPFRDYAVAGGLMSYGIDLLEVYRQVGLYAGRILKGAKPADLPVMQPTKFEFVINLKTAKALGVTLSGDLMSLADEVIE
jgi:putative tryptophan/tyrosine transport system substrate-binding protein